MFIKNKKYWFISLITCLLAACQSHSKIVKTNKEFYQYDNKAVWQEKLKRLKKGENIKFRIVQLGDSHTAGDYFTDALRTSLQQHFGDGGLGWISPVAVAGQRNANIQYVGKSWNVLSSRKDSGDFPLGGVIARNVHNAAMEIKSIKPDSRKKEIKIMLSSLLANNPLKVTDARGNMYEIPSQSADWRIVSFSANLPIRYQAETNDLWVLGQINIENSGRGVVLSAMGINGATLSHTQKWNTDWIVHLRQTEADLVILAYGTNEAFNQRLNLLETQMLWQDIIKKIKNALPNAGILIVGTPEVLANQNGRCGTILPMLRQMQQLQHQSAQSQKTLYWSWQEAMGGECSAKRWLQQGLLKKDGVHFTPEGYKRSAQKLANHLIGLAK